MKRMIAALLCLMMVLPLCACRQQVQPETAETQEPEPVHIEFEDVTPDDPFYEAVNYCVERGIVNGVSETSFAPDEPMTRAMLVTVLWRAIGSPESEDAGFSDVPADAWFADAVDWASDKSIVNGVGDNVFAPMSIVTNEQTCAILCRWSKLGDAYVHANADTGDAEGLLAPFADRDSISPWAQETMLWAIANGVVDSEAADGETLLLRPGEGTTRAQLCMAIMRLKES